MDPNLEEEINTLEEEGEEEEENENIVVNPAMRRYLDNRDRIENFAKNGRIPRERKREFTLALADYVHNNKDIKCIKTMCSHNKTLSTFGSKRVPIGERTRLLTQNRHQLQLIVSLLSLKRKNGR